MDGQRKPSNAVTGKKSVAERPHWSDRVDALKEAEYALLTILASKPPVRSRPPKLPGSDEPILDTHTDFVGDQEQTSRVPVS